MSESDIGNRLQSLRTQRGLSRERLAAVAEVSPHLIKSIEMGRRSLTLRTAQRIASALKLTDLGQLYGPQVMLAMESPPSHEAIPEVRKALTAWGISVTGSPETAEYLRGAIDQAWSTWHTSMHQRTEVGRILPGLIAAAQRSARLVEADAERRRIQAMEAQVYHIAQAYLAWHGERELVYLAVDRGICAALASGDPLAIAGSVWFAAHVLRAVGRADEALENLREARELLDRNQPSAGDTRARTEWLAMMADLWRCSAITKARAGDQGAWADHGRAEEIVTRQLPAGYLHPWTSTSRIIVDVEGVMIAADLGDAEEVRRRARDIDPADIPSTDRRARHLVEVARGTNLEGSPEATLHLLAQAAAVSAETVTFTPAAREMAQRLRRSSGSSSRQEVDRLAQQIGLEP